MRLIRFKIFFTVYLMVAFSCEKEPVPTKLPDATTIGANTFGCIIGDEIYIPEIRRLSLGSAIIFEYPEYPNYVFAVKTNRLADKTDPFGDAYLNFWVNNVTGIGEYKISGLVNYESYTYNADSFNNGRIVISYMDTINNIISGTFYFNAINEYDFTLLVISDGRFDLKND